MRRLSLAVLLMSVATLADAQTHLLGIVPAEGESTIAFDMNAAGQVAAVFKAADGQQRGVLFEKGVSTELALQPGSYSDAKAINARGEVVGSAQNGDGHSRAYLYARTKGMQDLGTLGGTSSFGMDINRTGQAVGFADLADGDDHAFLYDGKTMRDLGTLGGKNSYASGLNNRGQVVGTAALADNYRRAFVWDAEHGMVNLGTLGGRSSAAVAINDAGAIVGASETRDHTWHAFVYEGGRMRDLGAVIGRGSSFATGINSAGHVVGTVIVDDERRTFVWRDGNMIIHRGGRGLYVTNHISDAEQIIGASYFRVLEAATMPSNTRPAVVREVSTTLVPVLAFSLLAAGAAVVWRRRFRGAAPLRFHF